MKKVAILVLTAKMHPFDMMEECIRSTWGSVKNPNAEIWFYYGRSNELRVEGNDIYCPHPEGFENIGRKTISAFEHLLTTDFDYVFRPDSSSFVNIPKLVEYVQTLPNKNLYCGSLLYSHRPEICEFCCSGCGFFLSRDLVQLIVDNQEEWEHDYIDDMALCYFLGKKNILMMDSPRLKTLDIIDGELYDVTGKLTDDVILNSFHTTLRSGELQPCRENYREINCEMIKLLYEKVYSNEISNNFRIPPRLW